MSALDSSPRLSDPDGLYEALAQAHEGLPPETSRRFDAALVLLLANQVGDVALLKQAITAARAAILAADA